MKSILVALVVLSMPMIAFGGASFTLTLGGSGTNGDASISVYPGDSFTIDLGIFHDTDGISGFDCGLIASAADIFKATGRTVHLSYWDNHKPDLALFTNYSWLQLSASDYQNYGGMMQIPYGYWSGSSLLTQTITLATELTAPAGIYTISLGSAGEGCYNIADQDTQAMTIGETPSFEVTILPEPASLLLMVCFLPLLFRRRRSS